MNKVVRDMIMRRRRDSAYRDYNYDSNYDRAYDQGYDKAYDRAYDRAYDQAYDRAYKEGYDKGYDHAHNQLTPYGNSGMTVTGYEEYDGRQGVKGTGRYGIGGSRYYGRRDMGEDDMSLTHEDMKKWKRSLVNSDGTMGEHFSLPQIEQAMRTMNIQPRDYTEDDLCMVANMLYSDYNNTLKNTIPKEKELAYYTSMARDFLEDKDASVKGSEKLAAYYYCIVDKE
jgi:hypothetical protein